MKRFLALCILPFMLLSMMTSCKTNDVSEETNSIVSAAYESDASSYVTMSTGYRFDSLESVLQQEDYMPGGVKIVTGTMENSLIESKQFGDIRTFDVEEVIYGDISASEIGLLQMIYETPRLVSGRRYLLVLTNCPSDNVYEVCGFVNQCAFWIAENTLYGNDADLVAEIKADTAAQTYARNGNVPDVNTMDGLADYFAARIEALEKTK